MKRIVYLDYLKGFAILLVVWLHCIQYLFGVTAENGIFSNVVAFHMPLFMILSGFFFCKKLTDGSILMICKKQFQHLIIPSCTFGCIWIVLRLIYFNDIEGVSLLRIPFSYWFLSSLFFCSLSYLFLNRMNGGKLNAIIIVIILSLLSILIPFSEYLTFFIPFFGIGIIFSKKCLNFNVRYPWIMIIAIAFLFLLWRFKYSIYVTGNPSLLHFDATRITAYIMRLLIGCGITYGLVCLFKRYEAMIPMKNFFTILSKNSLSIYVMHMTFLPLLSLKIVISEWMIDVFSLIIALVIIVGMNILISWMRKSVFLKFIFLGEDNTLSNNR